MVTQEEELVGPLRMQSEASLVMEPANIIRHEESKAEEVLVEEEQLPV